MSDTSTKIRIFLSYSHKDEELRKELEAHLSVLYRQGDIDIWHDGKIFPGEEWSGKIKNELEVTDIVLMLISHDFLGSEYINNSEVKKALTLHNVGKLEVIPIILRECDWEGENWLSSFKVLPNNGNAIVGKHWHNRDEGFKDVVRGLKKVIKKKKERTHIKKIQPPGGPLQPDVVNYIERSADKQLNELLEYTSAPMVLIIGGIQCGKTSLIYRFLSKAKEKKDLKIIHVDFNKFLHTNNNPTIKDVFVYIIKRANEDLQGKSLNNSSLEKNYDSQIPEAWAKEQLEIILENNLAEHERAFFIIDSIDSLHNRLEKQEIIDRLINWFELLRNFQDTPPLIQLTIIVVMTILSYSSALSSPLSQQAFNISLLDFTKKEITQLMNRLDVKNRNEENPERIYNLFGGHPHLSHLAVYDIYSDIDFSEIERKATRLIAGYKYYWKKVKKTLEFILRENDTENKIDFILDTLISGNKRKINDKIITGLFEELFMLGLVNMNNELTSDFIQNAIKKELNENETI